MTAWIKTEEHARMMNMLEKRIAELEAIVVQQRAGFFEQDKRIAELEQRLKILYVNANGRMKEQCKDWFHEDGSTK